VGDRLVANDQALVAEQARAAVDTPCSASATITAPPRMLAVGTFNIASHALLRWHTIDPPGQPLGGAVGRRDERSLGPRAGLRGGKVR
jgi:hypothetical protein